MTVLTQNYFLDILYPDKRNFYDKSKFLDKRNISRLNKTNSSPTKIGGKVEVQGKTIIEAVLTKEEESKLRSDISAISYSSADIDLLEINYFNLMTKNAANSAKAFKIIIEAMFEHLIGAKNFTRTTTLQTLKKGIFGNIAGWIAVIENQAKGTLHTHFLIHGNLSPQLLQAIVEHEDLKNKAIEAIDTYAEATICKEKIQKFLETNAMKSTIHFDIGFIYIFLITINILKYINL